MTRKLIFFGRDIEWYDIKTKFKKSIRGLLYTYPVKQFICFFVVFYLWLVYLTSKKKFINAENFLDPIKNHKNLIISTWHNRLIMIPFIIRYAHVNAERDCTTMTLASRHGDGQFVGRVMEIFGFQNIYGSSNDRRKATRGIEISSLRELIRGLKNGKSLGITPDGPRGPNQKINSEIVNIAKISQVGIIPVSYSSPNFIQFNSWDKFKLPLPFSRLTFYFGEVLYVDKDISKEDEEKLRIELENRMNFAQEKSRDF